jgi:hypothetical protein
MDGAIRATDETFSKSFQKDIIRPWFSGSQESWAGREGSSWSCEEAAQSFWQLIRLGRPREGTEGPGGVGKKKTRINEE